MGLLGGDVVECGGCCEVGAVVGEGFAAGSVGYGSGPDVGSVEGGVCVLVGFVGCVGVGCGDAVGVGCVLGAVTEQASRPVRRGLGLLGLRGLMRRRRLRIG